MVLFGMYGISWVSNSEIIEDLKTGQTIRKIGLETRLLFSAG